MGSHSNKANKQSGESQATQLALTAPPHRNQQLFSDHYLNTVLPARTDWQLLATEAQAALHDLQALFATYKPSKVEAQVEDRWIKKVLGLLGHTFDVQPTLATPDGAKKPDYVFYRNQAAMDENNNQKLDEARLA